MTDQDTAMGGLYGRHPPEIRDANQQGRDPDDDWDAPYPPAKLWVHPDLDVTAETLCTPDEFDLAADDDGAVEFECPVVGCPKPLRMFEPFTYDDIKTHDGLVPCPKCDEPVLAHKAPPRGWTPPGQGGRP